MRKLSFVIPCYGSENTILFVLDEIRQTMESFADFEYEVVCVNDCSPDGVLEKLTEAAKTCGNLTVVDFAKNMGKHAAVMAGYSFVTGDLVVTMDDDGQCPIDKLALLIGEIDKGYDLAMAKYPERKQSAFKNFGSNVNAWMSQMLLNRPKDLQFSNFGVSRRFVVDEILRYRNPYPYLEGLTLRVTHRIANVPMEERERYAGSGSYTFRKSLSLWLNGFTAFSVKPLRIASVMGTAIACIGFVYGLVLIIRRLIGIDVMLGYSSTMAVLLFIGGVLMMMVGLVGEYIGRIYISINDSPQYVIRDVFFSGGSSKGAGSDGSKGSKGAKESKGSKDSEESQG
ncbi:MAG: glycosyltransferase family 2 protein [Clostridiales Family XIII bacterium]|jgi:undecaprenyl-phosphate 4-deoxy-4-formamido-L-arabinose transferase|nr:glycosyltransferase family 2 protein [Clostridiales Family XIII bacterium]